MLTVEVCSGAYKCFLFRTCLQHFWDQEALACRSQKWCKLIQLNAQTSVIPDPHSEHAESCVTSGGGRVSHLNLYLLSGNARTRFHQLFLSNDHVAERYCLVLRIWE